MKLALFALAILLVSHASTAAENTHNRAAEVTALPEGAAISEAMFKKYSQRELGRAIFDRVRARETRTDAPQSGYYDFWKDSKIMMVTGGRALPSILQTGKFRNRHQNDHALETPIWTTYGAESEMAGLKFPDNENGWALLPKYAYLAVDFTKPNMWRTRIDTMYGNIVAVFKDSIKDQVTFSPGNSWVIRRDIHSLAYKTAVPFPEPDYETSYGVHREWGHHWEAQIWGEVTLHDVDYFLINCPRFVKINRTALDNLIKTKKPIHLCINDLQNSEMNKGPRIVQKP